MRPKFFVKFRVKLTDKTQMFWKVNNQKNGPELRMNSIEGLVPTANAPLDNAVNDGLTQSTLKSNVESGL